jgi:hypothetical protein
MLAGVAIVIGTPAANAATYYVDAVSGSDSASGTSAATAWQTLTKVSATTFQPGDSILLHTDQTFAGRLAPKGSGSAAGGAITISSYGGGERPKIDASAIAGTNKCDAATALYFSNQEYWTIDGLEIVNSTGTDNLTGKVRTGICMLNNSANTKSGITIVNNYIHDVNGCFKCTYYDGHYNGAIIVSAPSGNYDDVYIAGNTLENVGRVGIAVADGSEGSLSTRVTIRNNTLNGVDGDGIIAWGTEGALIEHNVVGYSGRATVDGAGNPESAGIWWAHADHTTCQFNEVYGTSTHGFGGQAYDIDVSASNSKVQYNYSHDNEGGFLLLMGAGSEDAVVRYNLSVNDAIASPPGQGEGVITTSYGMTNNIDIHNNTLYVPPGSAAWIMACTGGPNDCNDYGTEDFRFRNNIVYNFGTGNYDYIQPTSATAFQNNLYYGNHPVAGPNVSGAQELGEPAEPGKLTTDPLLVAPGGPSPTDYQIPVNSPAVGAGALQPQNGGIDFFGGVLSATAAPSIGFHEAATFAGPARLQDGANDFLVLARATTGVSIDTATPSYFLGDTSRFSKSGGSSAGTITWLLDGMQNFQATLYLRQAQPSVVTFWASPDGRTFTQVGTVNTTPQSTASNWSVTTFTPAAPLSAGTRFLMASLNPPPPSLSVSPKVELGQISITK